MKTKENDDNNQYAMKRRSFLKKTTVLSAGAFSTGFMNLRAQGPNSGQCLLSWERTVPHITIHSPASVSWDFYYCVYKPNGTCSVSVESNCGYDGPHSVPQPGEVKVSCGPNTRPPIGDYCWIPTHIDAPVE